MFLNRVVLKNFKSIGFCDVQLQPLTFLLGRNGSGKSNFLDALHFVKDSLSISIASALNERGGLAEVRRRSSGHPTHFAIRLEFTLSTGAQGFYAFVVGSKSGQSYEIQQEECGLGGKGNGPYYKLMRGEVMESSEAVFPKTTSDRLALVAASGLPEFRPIFDALSSMVFYNLNPKIMMDVQKPQDGRYLKPLGENIASVIGHLEDSNPEALALIQEYLQVVAPMVHGVKRKGIGSMETLEFTQDMKGAKHPWRFEAQNMSDGTLRALGVLTALFHGEQGNLPTLVGIEEPETALHPAASAALRDALSRASGRTQVIVTSHSPDLLEDSSVGPDSLLSVVSEEGSTLIAPIDSAAREALKEHLFTAGELLRLGQLSIDRTLVDAQAQQQTDLFGYAE